jgi:prophage antirepressor-like protein
MAQTIHKVATTPVSVFNFHNHEVRIVMRDGEPWFVATDIAAALEYRNAPDMSRILDDDEAATHNLRIRSENGVEQDREVTIISESGMYHAVLKSRKPTAREFRRRVTSEVLPSIRKTGRYSNRPETPEETQRRQVALDFAFEAAKVAARTVADAFLNDEEPSPIRRYLLSMSWNYSTRAYDKACVQAINHDAHVMSLDELALAVVDPDYLVESEKLINLATACCQRLVKRLPLPKKGA